ncbi:hypothetical protein C9374_007318 [Naegleria lovaniensis]|uniref:Uncharacterized protein n=1 Tax=Naegleria lovaniensis TaxID=51637 RepID=A0AA88GGV5_NAELO|nr:uncharacterized protein C9374_007318 [Naegleria lovaniensis]KAG2379179.1 hypothetical protein C9374_007318 [Naegleria lovaniensis]
MQSSEDSTPTSPQQLESKPSANDKRVVIIGIMGDALKSSTEGLGLVEELNKQCLVCMNYLMTNIASSTGSRLGNQLNEQSGQQQTETQNLELKYLLYIYVNIDRLLDRNKSNINNDNASDLAKFFLYCTENIEKHAKFNSVYGTNINKLIYYLKIVSMYLNYQEHSFHGQLLNFNEKDIIFHAQLIYKVCVRFLTNYSSNLKLVAVTLVALSQCAKFLNSVDDFNTVFRIFCTYLDYKTKEMLSASQQEQVSSNSNTSPRIQRDLFDSLVKSTTNVIVCRNASQDQKRKLFFSVMNTGLVLFNSLKLRGFDVNPNIRHSISIIDQILRYCSSIYLFVSQTLEKSKQHNCEENKTLISEFIIEYAKLKIDEKEETEHFTLLTALVSWILHEKPMQDILTPLLDIVWKILDTIFTRPKRSIFSTIYCLISVQIAIYMDTYEKRDDYVEFVLNNILRVNIFLMPELMDALNKKLDLSDLKLIFSEYQKSTLYSYMYLVVNNLVTIPQTNPSRYIDFMYDFSKELSDTFSQAFSKNRPSKGPSLIDELVSMEDLKFHLKNISSLLLVFILKIYSNNSKLMNTSQSLAQIEKNEKISSENVIQIIKIFANTEFMKDLDSVSLYIQFMSKIIQYHHHTISDFISSATIFNTLNTQLTTSAGNMVLLSIIYFYLNFFSSLVKSKQYHEDLFKPHVIPFMFKCLLNSNKQIVQQAHHVLITFFTENYNVRNLILPHYLRVACDKKYSNTNSHLQSLFCNSFHFIFNHIKDSRLIEHSLNQIEQLIIHSNQASQKHLTKQLILLLFQSSQTIEYSHLPMLFSLLKRVLLSDKQLPLSSLLRDFYHIVNSCIDYVRRDDCVQFYLELSKDMM